MYEEGLIKLIVGLGTDVIEIARIDAVLTRHRDRFPSRLLSQEELAYWQVRGKKVQTLAGFWAAKEAVAKALGTGVRGFGWRDVVIAHDAWGRPYVSLQAGAAAAAAARGASSCWITIAHGREYAIATAILER